MKASALSLKPSGNPLASPVKSSQGQKAFLPCPVTGALKPMTLSADKAEAWGAEKDETESTSMVRVEIGFPSLGANVVRRNLTMKFAGDTKMVNAEACFPRDTGSVQVFVPKDVVVNFELLDYDKNDNVTRRSGTMFSNPQAANVPLEPSPLRIRMVGDCVVHHQKADPQNSKKELDPGKAETHTNTPPPPAGTKSEIHPTVPNPTPATPTPEGNKPPTTNVAPPKPTIPGAVMPEKPAPPVGPAK